MNNIEAIENLSLNDIVKLYDDVIENLSDRFFSSTYWFITCDNGNEDYFYDATYTAESISCYYGGGWCYGAMGTVCGCRVRGYACVVQIR